MDVLGIDVFQFGYVFEVSLEYMILFGVVVNGINYVGGCGICVGSYFYCENLVVFFYLIVKLVFVGVVLMCFEQCYLGS